MDITLQHLVEDHLYSAYIAISGHLEGITLQDGKILKDNVAPLSKCEDKL